MRTPTRDARAEAIRAYADSARHLRQAAREALQDGYASWFYEWTGYAAIAERAAKAEMTDRPPR